MKLPIETKTFHIIHYADLEDFIQQVYGDENYDFVAIQEANNDSSYEFNIDGVIHVWNQNDVDSIRKGVVPMHNNYLLMNLLVADGHLKPGTYIVKVSW